MTEEKINEEFDVEEFKEVLEESFMKSSYMEDLEDGMKMQLVKKFKQLYRMVWRNYVIEPKMHKAAYEYSCEYKLFYDNLSEKAKKVAEKTRKFMGPLGVALDIGYGPLTIASYGIRKLFKATPMQIVQKDDFTEMMKFLNIVMGNYSFENEEGNDEL